MMAWQAERDAEAIDGAATRGTVRRRVRLAAPASDGVRSVDVLVHNLSLTGMLVECGVPIAVGETIEIDLPEAGPTSAAVLWKSGDFHGCQFDRPIPSAAISASRLRSPVEAPDPLDLAEIVPAPGLHPALRGAIVVGASLGLWGLILSALTLA